MVSRASKKPLPYVVELDTLANGHLGTTTVTILDKKTGKYLTSDHGNLKSMEVRQRVARRLAEELKCDAQQLLEMIEAAWKESMERHRRQKQQAEAGSPEGPPRKAADPNDKRPHIVINTEEHLVVAAAVDAMAKNDPGIYKRGGKLVQVLRDSRPTGSRLVKRPPSAPYIATIQEAHLRTRLTRIARIVRPTDDYFLPTHAPKWLIPGILTEGTWPGIRHLEAIAEAPVLRADGSVLQKPGYDPETGVLYEPSGEYPKIPSRPTLEQARQAVAVLLDVVCDFPFLGPEHRSAWLAAVLTPLARFAFEGPSPLFLIEANTPGAGKGLLASPISLIATGRGFATHSYADDDREMRKTIMSIALQGDRLILFDNVAGEMGGAALAMALTTTTWAGRILGKSEAPRMPLLVTWVATGNNVALIDDIPRRTLYIRLESTEEHPEKRTGFKYPRLEEHIQKERGRLLVAALTILSGYITAGYPDQQLPPWGSYEGWSRLIRGAICWAGLPDPGIARCQYDRGNRELCLLNAFLEGWQEVGGDSENGLTVAEVLAKLKAAPPDQFPNMRDALAEAFSLRPGDFPGSRAVGKKLAAWEKRNVGGRCFKRVSSRGGIARWAVRPVASRPGPGGFGGFGGFDSTTFSPTRTESENAESGGPEEGSVRGEGERSKPTKPTKPRRGGYGDSDTDVFPDTEFFDGGGESSTSL